MATLTEDAQNNIRAIINDAVRNPQNLPGTTVAAINKNGDIIFSHSAGQLGVSTNEPVTDSSLYWTASCTKILATIVVLQAVEKGLFSLDSADDVERICPELASVKILRGMNPDGTPDLVDKQNRITVRMLLTHSAGFAYSFFNPLLKQYTEATNTDEIADGHNSLKTPLMFEPGTKWEYGVNLDWAGEMAARAEGKTLNELMLQNVLQPAGITETTLTPGAELSKTIVHMHARTPEGLVEIPFATPAMSDDPNAVAANFQSGGAGLFSRPTEYVKILAILLNDGVAAPTGARILAPETVQMMFTNQIPQWPDFGRQNIPAATPALTNPIPELFPQEGNPPQGWGLSWFINLQAGPYGRKAGSAFWCGLSNLFYFVDKESGIAVIAASQILPFLDVPLLTMFAQVEGAIYQGLQPAA